MPSSSALPYVWQAVFDALNVSALTSTLGCGVYDHVPQPPTFPHVRLANPTEHRMDRFGKEGKRITLQVHICTSSDQTRGLGQAATILSKVVELTNRVSLNISGSGYSLVQCYADDAFDAGDELVGKVVVRNLVQPLVIEVLKS